jgi:hypothetical protein
MKMQLMAKQKNERDSLTFIVWTRNNKNGKKQITFFCLDSLYDQMVECEGNDLNNEPAFRVDTFCDKKKSFFN